MRWKNEQNFCVYANFDQNSRKNQKSAIDPLKMRAPSQFLPKNREISQKLNRISYLQEPFKQACSRYETQIFARLYLV